MAVYNLVATEVITQQVFDSTGMTTVTYNPGDTVNRIIWDGVSPYTPPDGTELVLETSNVGNQ
jgi:hypothetical protein